MKKFVIGVAVAGLALSVSACSSQSGSSTSSSPSGAARAASLQLGQITPPKSFKPGDMNNGPSLQYVQAVYDSLLKPDNDAEPTPNLATSWSYDSAQTTLTLTLRDDVKFSDGTPFDATAVKANLVVAKEGTGETAGQLRSIKDVVVKDATHVDLVLSAPDPSLLLTLSNAAGMMASPNALSGASIATEPVGSGPYVLDASATVSAKKYVYTANPNYWNKDVVHFDNLTITVFQDANATLNALRTGQLNGAAITDPKNATVAESAGLSVVWYPSNTSAGLFLWDREGKVAPELQDVRVRQAINYAFDRDAILEAVFAGHGKATSQIFNVGSTAFDATLDGKYTKDLTKAKQLLADAGYPNGFELSMPDVSPVYPAQQAVVTEGLASIGITAKYTPSSADQFIPSLLGGKFPANYFSLDNFTSWDTTQIALVPEALWNVFHVADPKIIELVTKAQGETGDAQTATFKELNAYIVDQAWFAIWAQPDNAYTTTKTVTTTPARFMSAPPIWNFLPAS